MVFFLPVNSETKLTSSLRLDTKRTQFGGLGCPGSLIPALRAAADGVTPARGMPVKGIPVIKTT